MELLTGRSHSQASGYPVAVGVVVALAVSLTKSTVRPAANVAIAGTAAPLLSTLEDIASIVLVVLAVLLPVLVLVAAVAMGWAGVRLIRRRRRAAEPPSRRADTVAA